MDDDQPSRTALAAAAHRAAHQILEHGSIFRDPLAVRLVGENARALRERVDGRAENRSLRLFIAARSRFAEDALARAVADGVRQLVVLGAGLDTLAYRVEPAWGLRVFEVDHPATQAWKRRRLSAAGIGIPPAVAFTAIDFGHQSLSERLEASGFDVRQAAFFTWLGVVPYLELEAVLATVDFIAAIAPPSQVVFDYANPPDGLAGGARVAHDRLAARVARAGEPFRCYLDTAWLHVRLGERGFTRIEDLGPAQLAARFAPGVEPVPVDRGGHVIHAATGASAR